MSRRGASKPGGKKGKRPNYMAQAYQAELALKKNSVKETVELAKKFYEDGLYDRAFKLCDTAEDKAYEVCDPDDDVFADIHGIRSQLYIKKNDPESALAEAGEMMERMECCPISNLRYAQALKAGGKWIDCFGHLMEGLKNFCETDEDRVMYFAELASVISLVNVENDNVYSEIDIPSSPLFWSHVLKTLADTNSWQAVCVLILGLTNGHDSPLECIASDASTTGIAVSKLFRNLPDVELKKWGIKLAICLLKKGAAIESITADVMEPVPVAAIVSAIRTGNNDLFKYVMETSSKVRLQIDNKNNNGDTPLHILVKSGKTDSFSGEALLKLLLNYGASVNVRDKTGKLAIEYLGSRTPAYSILGQAANYADCGLRKRITAMKDEGNKSQQEKDPFGALRWYKDAITLAENIPSLKQELAILHSNCSLVYSNLRMYKDALRSAEETLACDPTFYKGYWRQAQVLKQLGRAEESLGMFIQGLERSTLTSDDIKVIFLAGIAELLPVLSHKKYGYEQQLEKVVPMFRSLMPKVLESLTKSSSFDAIKILILGETYVPVKRHFKGSSILSRNPLPMPEPLGIGSRFNANGVLLSPYVSAPETDWVDELVIILLSKGAPCNSLMTSADDTPLHAAVRLCHKTGSTLLLEYVLQTNPRFLDQSFIQDNIGRSLYHTVCECCPSGDSPIGLKLVEILLHLKFDCTVQDRLRRRASDLVPPHSKMYKLLSKNSPATNDRDAKNLKEDGNREFQRQNFQEAIAIYTKAIDQMMYKAQKSNLMFSKQENHDLAVLYGNRAECYLKREMPQEALEDGMESVSFDGHWYKAHMRVGRALQVLKRTDHAINAFVNAYNSLSGDSAEKVHKEILTELLTTVSQSSRIIPGQQIPNLNSVRGEMWAKMAYEFIERTSQWGTAHYAFKLFSAAPPRTYSKITLDLKPLCDRQNLSRHGWGAQLILYFLKCGSDHHTLHFQHGDTYLHAAVFMVFVTGDMAVLKWLFDTIVLRACEMNIEDISGNTVLHMVSSAKSQPDVKIRLIVFLVENGVSPLHRNRHGQTALDCVPQHEQEAIQVMMLAMQGAVDGRFVVKKPKIPAGDLYVPKRTNPPINQPQESKQSSTKSSKKPAPKKQFCDRCDEMYEEGMALVEDGETGKGVSKFVSVLLWEHKGPRHQQIAEKCLNEIIKWLGRALTPDLPDSLKKLSPSIMKVIIEKFGVNERWRHLEVAINLYGADRMPKAFAKNISIMSLLGSKSLLGSESHRLKIMTLLQTHGAKLHVDKGKQAMEAALENNEVRLVHRLMEEGVSPSVISVEDGDTPVHAALNIALDRDKGNFSLLEKLLDLYKSDPGKYPYLDPKGVNRGGDTLLHAACRCKYNKHSQKAVEFLCSQQVPADVVNKEGKMPIQYLTNRNDRRAQFLRVVGGTAPTAKSKPTEPQQRKTIVVKEKSRKNEQLPDDDEDDDDESSPERTEVIDDIRVKAVYLVGVAQSKERIKEILNERPDPQISIYKDGKTKDRFGPSPSKVEDKADEDKAETLAEERMGSPRKENRTVAERMLEEEESLEGEEKVNEELDEEDETEEEFDISVSTFDNLAWEVECTADVWKCLRDKHVLPELKQRAIRKIELLAKGEWRPYLRKRVTNAPPTLELYEAKLSKAARIIWEVAVAFSARCSEEAEKRLDGEEGQEFAVKGGRIYSEIIRVWDIVFDHDNLYRSIQNIIKSHSRGETCILKKKLKGVKDSQFEGGISKRYPMLFAEQDDDLSLEAVRDKQQMLLYPPASANETEYHILKFYSFSTALVNIILQNIERKVDFPFRVTDKEHAIIHLKSKSPILLIGRSGTGKTTCCLYRLWTSFISYWILAKETQEPFLPRAERFIEDDRYSDADAEDLEEDGQSQEEDEAAQAEQAASTKTDSEALSQCPDADNEEEDEYGGPEYDHLHQIFVTKNPVLCSEVHKNFYELCHAHDETKDHTDKEAEDLPPKLQDIEDLSYPLFLTSKQLLLMLDASLEAPHFFDRNEDGSLSVRVQGWGAQDELFGFTTLDPDSDDEDEENDMDENMDEVDDDVPDHAAAPNRQQQKLDPRREVTYEVFAEEVWPKIVKKMSVNYHPSLVWTEIMSFIKGSFEALTKQGGHLSKDEYVELGKKRAPNFSGERDKVYELYKRYDHFKKQKFLFDEADLVQNIYKRLRSMTHQPWVFHQLYVDETQDFTQAELCVLLRISQNPNDMFLTGDTAQGIMRGISFRFSDLRSLFFYAKKSLHARGQIGTVNVPKQIYQLTHNYRSHAGILSLASAVLDLMVEFFPESFDRLQKDQGLFYGPPPILLESCSLGDLAILLQGNKRKTSHIEFGAHQAILVVNDSVKNNMPEELSHGIVLTIYEAKGLEFDDVLLYNFFKDSQASKEWRVVTSFLERLAKSAEEEKQTESLVTIDEEILKQSKRPRPLTFDPNQHKVLNSEMKHLYTALTRARVNVWIFDEDEEKRAPMFEYFKARKLIRCITDQEMDAGGSMENTMFAEKSTPEDWVKRGDEMMGRCLYEVAAKCYKMGGDENKEKIAMAHNQALKASRMKDNPKKMREEFVFAAEKFMESGHDNKAALCLQNAKEYELAALVFEKCGMLGDAAKMYRRCKKHIDGSRCYEQMGNYHKAVEVLDNEELYDQAIDCLERYKLVVSEMERKGQDIPRVLLQYKPGINFTVARLSYKAANFYHKYRNEAKMVEALERLPRVEDRLDFLKKRAYVEHAATLMMEDGKKTEAARMMLQHGKVEKALEFAEKGDDQEVLGDCHYAQALALMSSKDGFNQDRIISHLTSARDAYSAVGKTDSVGVSCLALASIKLDIETAKKAFHCFKSVRPFENEVGKLETLDLIVQLSSMDDEFSDIMAVIRGVDSLFAVMKAFLKPTTTEEKSRSQVYLQFYGLYEKDVNTLVVYPKQKPRCVRVIPDFYATKQEKKQASVEKDKKWICVKISIHLVDMLKHWINASRDSLRSHVSHRLQCKSHMEGEDCPDEDYCPYLHRDYNRGLAFNALEALLWEVHLDSILQTGARNIKGLSIQGLEGEVKELYKQISSLIDESTQFDSCERLLDFLVPEHHHMRTVTENPAVTRELVNRLSFGKVSSQVSRFLDYSWKFQDRKLPIMELLEKRSKSTDWFVRATLFSSLFRLKIDIKKHCQQLERELMRYTPKWLDKRRKYALLADFHRHILTVECLGRKFYEVHVWLQEKPLKAIIEYAKFVKILSDRGRLSLFPKVPLLLFWQEVFVCVAFFNIAKLSGGNFVLPATYLATIPFVNATFPKGDVSIQELVNRSGDRKDNINVVKDRFLQIAGVICGQRMNLLRMIFTPKKDGSEIKYLQAERCLVLALVVLVNIGTFVSENMENPLMSTIMKLNLSEDAPYRLRNSLQAVKQSRGIKDIVIILRDLLSQREEEYLLTCFWKWDNQRKQGAQFQQLKRLDSFPNKFFVFDPNNLLPDDENALIFDDEEELGLTAEDAQRRQEEHHQYEEELRRDKSAKKLQKYFKRLTFMGRLESGNFLRICMTQEMKEVFAPFEVTEKMCGVCGVPFQSDELAMQDLREDEDMNEVDVTPQSPAVQTLDAAAKTLWSPGKPTTTPLESHRTTTEHVQRKFQFETFKRLHEDFFVLIVPEMRKFITRMKLRDSDFTTEHYPDQALDVSRLTSQMDEVLTAHRAILSERNWSQTTTLRDKVVQLHSDYTRVGDEIISKYREYLEHQQQTLEKQNEARQQKAAKEDDPEEEDWDREILEVVEEPVVRKKEPRGRPKGGGGGGGGRGRQKERQDNRELDGERDRHYGRGRARGRGRDAHHRDFVNDLPPRFQRLQQVQQQYDRTRYQVPS